MAAQERSISTFGFALLVLLTVACRAPGPPAPTAGDPTALVVGALPFVSSAPLFLAEEAGYYAREGLDVELRFFRAAQPVALAATTGDIDFGVTGLTAGFFNLAAQGRLKIVAAQAAVTPGYPFIAICVSQKAWDQGLRSLDDFPGRRVGITQQGSTFHYMMGQLADSRGFDLEAVDLVSLESVPNMVAAFRGGSVESIMLPAHLAEPLQEEGVARILGWAGEENPWQLGALFTSSANVVERPEVVAGFVRAYRSAAELYAKAFLQRDDNGERIFDESSMELAAALQKYVPASVPEILAGAPFIASDVAISATDIAPQIEWFQAHGLVNANLAAADLVDARYAPADSEGL